MTVKRRLALSNVIMIVIPVVITLCTGLLCLAEIYMTLKYSNGFGFESGSEFYNISHAVSGRVDEIFEDGTDVQSKLKSIGNVIDTSSTYLQAYENDQLIYSTGNSDVISENLMRSAKNAGNRSFVSDGKKELLHLNMSVLPMLMIFGMGILAGALGSVRGIQKCLEKVQK